MNLNETWAHGAKPGDSPIESREEPIEDADMALDRANGELMRLDPKQTTLEEVANAILALARHTGNLA